MNAFVRLAQYSIAAALLLPLDAHAINAAYRKKLERSGCTQMSEMQGCDIDKTRAENAKAGFVADPKTADAAAPATSPYAGHWTAKASDGAVVAEIEINTAGDVLVGGKKVKAKRSDGALVFIQGMVIYTIHGDHRAASEDSWHDRDAGTSGPIVKR